VAIGDDQTNHARHQIRWRHAYRGKR
jgi:hypothetical protein